MSTTSSNPEGNEKSVSSSIILFSSKLNFCTFSKTIILQGQIIKELISFLDNQTIATKTEIKTTKKSTTQPREATEDLTITTTNKQEPLSYSTTVKTNAKEICTRAQTTISTIITNNTPFLNDSDANEISTNSQTTDHSNTASLSTTVDTFTTSKETRSTTNKEETTETKESTVMTTPSITETLVNSVNTEAVSTIRLNSVSPRKPCTTYPKHCGRPTSWETTAKGETRDFYRILKARYGDRIKVLRGTTNWPRHMNDFNGLRPEFFFGRHIES